MDSSTTFRLRNSRVAFSPLSTYVHLKDLGSASAFAVDPAEYWKDAALRPELASGRLVAASRQEKDMPHWEMHPAGDELLVPLSGEYELLLQDKPGDLVVPLRPGQVALVPFGIWHRLRVKTPGEILFVTPGKGTQQRTL